MRTSHRGLMATCAALLFAFAALPADAATPRKSSGEAQARPASAKKASTTSKAAAHKPVRSAALVRTPQRKNVRVTHVSRPVAREFDAVGNPLLRSNAFMVQDLSSGRVLLEHNAEMAVPIASITKLMTVMVVLDAQLPLSEELTISDEDTDKLKNTSSRLIVGTTFPREMMIHLALMSSENRAAAALGHNYPGGIDAFVAAMNRKAESLGLTETRFHDSTGLNPHNVSSARDLAKMVTAASHYPLIREFSTDDEEIVQVGGRLQTFRNTNALVKAEDWEIGVSKTGFINEAGRCLVMQAWLANKPMVIVLLDSAGKFTRVADAQRIKRWMETAVAQKQLAMKAS
ncbi:D-alanyl-D-alanine endopeptidase [Niveibacterium sp. SC-1]|uniref:D-alanyl-D-alanine endopeptidase n=1 Tax=Niveibacterium sp. SC-1 TaxID=3135646 RepID=UPI00311D4AD8